MNHFYDKLLLNIFMGSCVSGYFSCMTPKTHFVAIFLVFDLQSSKSMLIYDYTE